MKEKEKKNGDFHIPVEALKKIKSQSELDDFFHALYKQAIEGMLKAEMEEHLGYAKHHPRDKLGDNSRNGYSNKKLKTSIGDIPLDVPRDRDSSFDPVIVPKHQRMSARIEQAIITLYSRGMTTRDIEETIKDVYGVQLSEGSVSHITNSLIEDIKQWQQRPLQTVYFIVWMDGIVIKVRHNGRVIGKTIYLIIGLRKDGIKEVLGMWISETESASFWLNVLTDLKARGVEDILIASMDNLAGIRQAIKAVFPHTVTQLCIVHQIRNSTRYVAVKDRREFMSDLKLVYTAQNKEMAMDALDSFEEKWINKYAYAIRSWRNNWEELTAYFEYPLEIRKIMYTTNTIESLNSSIRKYTKTKTVFPDDQAALKAVYLAINNIQKKWIYAIGSWGLILNQFVIKFEQRCQI
jgi:transposase-like protein